MSRTFWLKNAWIMTQDKKRQAFLGSVLVRDGRIESVKKGAPPKSKIPSHDLNERVLLPGFVQAHVHLCQTLFRNMADDLELLDWLSERIWPLEASHTEETMYASALLGISELLSSGTTCVLDMGSVRHTQSILKAVGETGIRASVGKCLMDHPRTTPPNLRERTDRAIQESIDLYETYHGAYDGRLRISFAPRFVVSCTEALLTEVRDYAQKRRATIHTHASENLKEIQLVKKLVGCENVEYLHQLELTGPELVLAHCIWLKPGEMNLLKRTGTHVAHCPSSNMKLASGFARVPEMLTKGINVALGADGAPCNNQLSMFNEMRMSALIHKPASGPRSMRAQEVLDMATRGGAKALGWFDEIGSIEVGKKADFVCLDLNRIETFLTDHSASAIASAIVYSSSASNVEWTMVDGVRVYEKSRGLKKHSAETILRLATNVRRKLNKKFL